MPMAKSELPDEAGGRVSWVIRAPTQEELRRRYDLWSAKYDDDLGRVEDYLAPMLTADVAKACLAPDACILDAGAGTGLAGAALKQAGFANLVGVDFSPGMLAVAEKKGIYRKTIVADLGRRTPLAEHSFDAVVTVGTTSQMPCESLVEFVRLVRPGGHIIFTTWAQPYVERGYAAVQA